MLLFLHIFVVLLSLNPTNSNERESIHDANCSINKNQFPCQIALFSLFNFSLSNEINNQIHITNYFCNGEQRKEKKTSDIAYSIRGYCSFDEKALNAMKLGYKLLIIVNSDDNLFPPGSSDPIFQSSIPVILFPNSMLHTLQSLHQVCYDEKVCENKIINILISYGNIKCIIFENF